MKNKLDKILDKLNKVEGKVKKIRDGIDDKINSISSRKIYLAAKVLALIVMLIIIYSVVKGDAELVPYHAITVAFLLYISEKECGFIQQISEEENEANN